MIDADDAFLGRGWSFPPTFDATTGGVEMVAAEEDIRQSLQILFSTSRGERVMLPLFGSALDSFVFAGMDNTLQTHMKSVIEDAILNFEPRIVLERIDVHPDQHVDGVLKITLTYLIRSLNSRSNMVFPFYLAEGTNVESGAP
jgi:phage baseplate assembly protein W